MPEFPSQIGPYAITRELGRGGMGVVYLARDSRLDRPVAIKALPAHLAQDPNRLGRFEREARTLASLNHPGVAGIYGVEEQDGQRFLVLEYVEGESLAARLERGALPVDEAIEVAVQIAAGLEAAHDKGVIHRDLKPGNVMITPEGKSKVLDFGLARTEDGASSSSRIGSATESPTLTTPAYAHSPTIPGVIMGTAGYMSPEQARGKPVDKRSDIFSFGCVLFEMLTGEPPFRGETLSDSIGALLHKEPDWSLLAQAAPPELARVLRRCLEKDKSQRLHDIADARIELEAIPKNPALWETAPAGSTDAGSRRGVFAAALALALSLVAAIGVIVGRQFTAAPLNQSAPFNAGFMKLTDAAGVEQWPSISPDGGSFVYASQESGNWDIYLQRIGGANPLNLTERHPEDDTMPAFSPDGSQIVFRSERDGGGLFIMGATGESPRRLTRDGFDPVWAPDGRSVVYATEGAPHPRSRTTVSSIWEVDIASGERRQIFAGDGVHPVVSSDGRFVAFWALAGTGGVRNIYAIPREGGAHFPVVESPHTDWAPVFAPGGSSLYFGSDRGGALRIWRVPIDPETCTPAGPPAPVTSGGLGEDRRISISADGRRLVFSTFIISSNIESAPLDPETLQIVGAPTPIVVGTGVNDFARWSPDGRSIAFISLTQRENLIVMDADGANRRQLTHDDARVRGPAWSPDGKTIAFFSDRGGDSYRIWSIQPDGSGLAMVGELTDGRYVISPEWSPDGSRIVATVRPTGVVVLPADGQGPMQEAPPAPEWMRRFLPTLWSRDGERLMGVAQFDDERFAPAEYNFNTGEYRLLLDINASSATASVAYLWWLTDEARALFVDHNGACGMLDIRDGSVRTLASIAPDEFGNVFDVSPDGGRLLYTRYRTEADVWIAELEN